jgi:hypothetical protein
MEEIDFPRALEELGWLVLKDSEDVGFPPWFDEVTRNMSMAVRCGRAGRCWTAYLGSWLDRYALDSGRPKLLETRAGGLHDRCCRAVGIHVKCLRQ